MAGPKLFNITEFHCIPVSDFLTIILALAFDVYFTLVHFLKYQILNVFDKINILYWNNFVS